MLTPDSGALVTQLVTAGITTIVTVPSSVAYTLLKRGNKSDVQMARIEERLLAIDKRLDKLEVMADGGREH